MNILFPYEFKLKRDILSRKLPEYITIILTEQDVWGEGIKKLSETVKWCSELGVRLLSVYIDILPIGEVREELSKNIADSIYTLFKDSGYKVKLFKLCDQEIVEEEILPFRNKYPEVMVSIGIGGRKELTYVIRKILTRVKRGELRADDIDERDVEKHLLFPHDPELVIRAGGKRLADFLVWQSVYSELYFTDVNWKSFRKIDFLRAVRDYQKRQRRFGR
jgi:undecaprenyl diphosphate synthase